MNAALSPARFGAMGICLALFVFAVAGRVVADIPGAPIPFNQLGAQAQKQYSGDGLALTPTNDGARLRCDFQRLEGELTGTGLWLRSTAANASGKPFRVLASAFGRTGAAGATLSATGDVQATDKVARLLRPGLTEEYSVSVDGVRQDFVVLARPTGEGDLRVDLAVDGARAEPVAAGTQLVLADGGRKLAYSRLRVTDATGHELIARLRVTAADRLVVTVADAGATYPVRIDPTFSDANWVSLNPGIPGANATVNAVVVDDSGNLYVGGAFTFVGTVAANRVAKWDGSTWTALGVGMDEGTATVSALAVSGTNLYAGGVFTRAGGLTANRVAKWDGSAWSPLGSGMNSVVSVLAVSGTNLYAGGNFDTASGTTVNHVAKWNGSVWSALGSGTDDNVYALAVDGTNLYVGGTFDFAGGVRVSSIARWDGSAWSAVGLGFNSSVFALAVSGTDLYAGGTFSRATNAGPAVVTASYIAKWNGSAWSAVGSGMSGSVYEFVVNGPDLYVSGTFTNAGGVPAKRVAKWNGSAWSAVGSGMSDSVVNSMVLIGTNLYAGGTFTNAGGVMALCLAKWDGSAWSALGAGMDNTVDALAVSGTDVYVGGNFNTAGGVPANRIAKWNGSAWSALGSGMDYSVAVLTVSGGDLYAGGAFTNAGGVTANGVAKWNGSSWSALGSGMANNPSPATVTALAVVGSDLYAGGSFHTAGGGAALRIAKWNGSAWSAVGGGFTGVPNTMAVIGTDLYVGGGFTQIAGGGITVNRIAKWNGSAWSALGTGMSSSVNALAVIGTDLYAGGSFLTADGITVNRVAKWNGSTWSALGSGVNQTVYSLAAGGANLFAGGAFTTATNAGPSTVAVNRIAKWDGSAWSALGTGVDNVNVVAGLSGNVSALAVQGGANLILGGSFFFVGTTISPYIALADLDGIVPTVTSVVGPTGGSYRAGQGLSFAVNFSAAVTVTGTPQLPLTIGPTLVNATYVSGSGSTALVFTYTVQSGDTDTDGIATVSPLSLNGGVLQAADATDAELAFFPPDTSAVRVDTTAPTISLSAPSASSTVTGPVTYIVTYADANFSASTLVTANVTLNKTGAADGNVAVTGSGLTRTVTISGITGLGTLGISVAAGTATDTAGNTTAGAGPSTTFAVVLPTPAAIAQEPTNRVMVAGGNATFSVDATGTGPLHYQWLFNTTNVLAGATNASLTVTNAQPANAGGYSVAVTNMAGSATSVVATLIVLVPPSVAMQPTNVTLSALTDASFTVSAAGTLPLAYQWTKDNVAIGGETNAVLTLNAVTVNTAGTYRVVITNVAGTVTSSTAVLTVIRLVPPLTWTTPAAITYGTILGTAQLNASTGPAGSFAYSPGPGTLPKAGTRPLNVFFTPSDTSVYAPANGSVSLTVNPAPLTVTAQDQSRLYGTANPALTVSYGGFVNGETAAVLTTAPTASTVADANSLPGNYPIAVSGASATNYAVTHVNGTLTVTADGPGISAPPTNVTVVAGGNATFSVGAAGTGPLAYQWFFASTNSLTGATNASLTVTDAQPVNAGGYSVVVTNVVGSVTSVVAILTVLVPPSVTQAPTNQLILVGANLTLTVSATGTQPLFYQWLKENSPILDATNVWLTFNSVNLLQAGRYSVMVSNAAASETSLPATIVVAHSAIAPPIRPSPEALQATGFPLSLFGEVGRAFRVQVTYDLRSWEDVTNFTSTGAAFEFVDSRTTNRTRGFYRIVSP